MIKPCRPHRRPDWLFVYGTLQSGFSNRYSRLLQQYAISHGEAHITGRLFDVGRYPALQPLASFPCAIPDTTYPDEKPLPVSWEGHWPASSQCHRQRESQRVYGELFALPSGLRRQQLLTWLDDYEESSARFPVPREYRRYPLAVSCGDQIRVAWCYCYQWPVRGLRQIRSGRYCPPRR